jgi:hypothetical protein
MDQETQPQETQQELPMPSVDDEPKSHNQEYRDALALLESGEEMSAEEALGVEDSEKQEEVKAEPESTEETVEASDEAESDEPEVPEDVQDEKLSGGWAKLMRMHAKVQNQAQELRDRERQLESYMGQAQELNQLAELVKKDPIAFLEKQGVDFEKAFQRWTSQINGETVEEKAPVMTQEEINQEIQRQVQANIQRQRVEMEAERWFNEAELVCKDDKYQPLYYFFDEGEEVVKEAAQLAANSLTESGVNLTPRQATDMLLEEANRRLQLISEKVAGTNPNEQTQQPKPARKGRTLSNSLDESSPVSIRDDEPGDDYQELQKALKLVR